MTISNSKKQLAKIIHENGGWRDGMSFSWYGNKTGKGYFGKLRPRFDKVSGAMIAYGVLGAGFVPFECKKLPNWHQTILSRDEYFHLYPVAEAAPEPVVEAKPTIEQLAADYSNRKDYADHKQQEADAAKADADAKLAELVAAGKALGLALSVATPESELAITDWRDLQVGDVILCVGNAWDNDFEGSEAVVTGIESHDYKYEHRIRACIGEESDWGADFHFIRRPAKGDANA